MSFGTGGFGFGQTNNNQQSSGFGGFGSNNTNTGSAFGSNTTGAFGANNAINNASGGALFGGSTGGGFGSAGGGFGSPATTSAFGAKPGFGSTATSTGGGLFGSSATNAGNTGFGGFGSNTNTNTATNTTTPATGFGGGGSSLFGANKPNAFGSTNTGSSMFGAGNTATGFGGGTSTFGATNNPGIGGNIGDAPGTVNLQFQPYVEKEVNNASLQNAFQNILFMDAYKKWSAEELRLADYNQGRRHGTATGGTGAFGVSTGFGSTGFGGTSQTPTGFGGAANTGGNLFGGAGGSTTGGFGSPQNTNTAGAFGSGGGALFGQNKPAGAGIFGNTPQPAQTGGLFAGSGGFGSTAAAANTTGGFGAAANNTSGGLFGGQTANQNKPAGFSFGSSTNATNNAFGGGNNTTPTGGLFGSTPNNTTSSGAGLLGINPAQSATGTGLFGGGQQQQTTNAFGGGGFGAQNNQQQTGTSLFGQNNQQKPATGLFGGSTGAPTTTGGGLFGNNANNNNIGSGFGASNNNQSSGGLFGQKPAGALGGGVFGSGTQNQTGSTGTGLFGGLVTGQQNQLLQQQQQQPAPTGLFGGAQNQQQKSLFGGSTQSTGTGLFGGQANQNLGGGGGGGGGGGLFGNSIQQLPQNPGMGSSMFNTSQGNQSTPQPLTTSINDVSAYGTPSLFQNLGNGDVQNPGPLATPLSSNKNKSRRSSILPMYRLNPGSASMFATPQKRGYGLSYSTYGSPATPSSVGSTPGGLGQSLLGGSIGRNMGKSISSSNLRRSFNVEESILAPGAFSNAGPRHYGSTGSVKKLVINRDLRSDLFSSPSKDKENEDLGGARKLSKRVSFDTQPVAAIENGAANGSPASASGYGGGAADLGFLRPSKSANDVNGAQLPNGTPEQMEQVKGNELAIVHEHEEDPSAATPKASDANGGDLTPGAYWMRPTKEEIQNMNRVQRQRVVDFTVGREHVGQIRFRIPVDLSSIDLDDLIGGIVILVTRSATVYPNPGKKPPVGKGLNVPAEIALEQSWPRGGRDKKTIIHDKSGHRLNKHVERLRRIEGTDFASYEENTGVWTFTVEHFTTYGLDDDDETDNESAIEQQADDDALTPTPVAQPRQSAAERVVASPELDPDDTFDFRRKRIALPGAFDYTEADDDDDDDEADDAINNNNNNNQEPSFLSDRSAGSASYEVMPYEADAEAMDGGYDEYEGQEETGLALVPHHAAEHDDEDVPQYYEQPLVDVQETPGGIMRARLRALKDAASPLKLQVADGDDWVNMLQKSVSPQKRTDRAALRVLNEEELYGTAQAQEGGRQSVAGPAQKKQLNMADGQGFATSLDLMNSLFERARDVSQNVQAPARARSLVKWPSYDQGGIVISEPPIYKLNGTMVSWDQANQVPVLALPPKADLQSLDPGLTGDDKKVWELASILFDSGISNKSRRRAGLSEFWKTLVHDATSASVAAARSGEEKAVACLAGHRVAEACKHLRDSRNVKLGALLALISASDRSRADMQEQMGAWQRTNILSEVTEPIRAIYALLSGNVGVCEGKKDVAVENRMESFVISERFALDWKQAFGLRLWYALSTGDDIAAAVKLFKEDIDQGIERAPEDLLWGLLKLYAGEAALEETLSPERGGLRICWLLGQALVLTGKATFSQDPVGKADALTLALADQARGNDARAAAHSMSAWGEVAWILLHLADPLARGAAVRDHVGRNVELVFAEWIRAFANLSGGDLPSHSPPSSLNGTRAQRSALWKALHIPEQWGYEALALFARSRGGDSHVYLEAFALLKASLLADAHRVVVGKIAPAALVEHTPAAWRRLAFFLGWFRGRESAVPDWNLGGAVYVKYLGLVNKGQEREALALIDRHTKVLGDGGSFALADVARTAAREAPARWSLEKAAGLYEALLVGS